MSELPKDIKAIDERIRKLQEKKDKTAKKETYTSFLLKQAFRYMAEFVSPVIIALALGYLADNFLGTKPIIMLILAVFGCAAGVLNVYKAALETDKDIR